jgi:hypothetical protein
MTTYTDRLVLAKPDYTDFEDINVLNSNMDTLDDDITRLLKLPGDQVLVNLEYASILGLKLTLPAGKWELEYNIKFTIGGVSGTNVRLQQIAPPPIVGLVTPGNNSSPGTGSFTTIDPDTAVSDEVSIINQVFGTGTNHALLVKTYVETAVAGDYLLALKNTLNLATITVRTQSLVTYKAVV